jgi:hypothetical protein
MKALRIPDLMGTAVSRMIYDPQDFTFFPEN